MPRPRGAAGVESHYLDAAAFTQLFADRAANHAQICAGLQLIVGGVARRFWFPSPDDREDHEAEALLYAIRRIGGYAPDNAFSYYTTLVFNRLQKQLVQAALRQGRGARLFTDVAAHAGDDDDDARQVLDGARSYTGASR